MRKIKMLVLFTVAFSICLLTACGNSTNTKQPPDLSKAFTEESEPEVSQNVIDAMNRYEECVDAYCEFMDLWFKLDLNGQIQYMDKYTAVNNELAHNQEIMQEILNRKDDFNDTDYAYMEQVVLRCGQKLLTCASNGLDTIQEDQNG